VREKIITLGANKVLLIIFSIITLTSIILIIFEKTERVQTINSNIIDFHLTVTSESIVIGNSYSNIITPYFISKSSSGRIDTGVFPLKLPRFIKIQDETINLKTWNFEISNVIILKNVEVDSRKVVQKANVANLRICIEEENREDSLSNLCFKLMLETIDATNSYKSFSGSLKPLTGHLYGGSYTLLEAKIRVIVTWEPFDKTIFLSVYHGDEEIQNYLLEGGEWSGFIMVPKDGLDFLVIGNLDESTEISYSIIYTLD